jgi:uncharacterized protein YegL
VSSAPRVPTTPAGVDRGLTSYGDAFRLLRTVISRDIADLKQQGYRVYRPAVFFISDGEPSESWESDYDDLIDDPGTRPNIVSFGVDSADIGVMKRIATVACYMAEDNANPGPVLREIMKALTNSIITSTSAPTPQFVAPAAPDGCVAVPLDEM